MGYEKAVYQGLPQEVLASFCGVGNPFSLGPISSGSSILDIGCGAGFDLVVASKLVGDTGTVAGVDLTAEMTKKASKNLETLGINNAVVHQTETEILPFEDSSFDVVISNGVINLSPDKKRLFGEIYRVLKVNGTLQFADIILEKALPPEQSQSVESWSQ